MTAFAEEAYLKERVRSDCAGLKYRLREYVSDFPAGSPQLLIAIVEKVIAELELGLPSLNDVHQLQDHFRVLDSLSEILTFLDNAHTAQTPRGLVQMVQKMAGLLFPGAELLVAPTAEYNYSIGDIVPYLTKLASGPLSTDARKRLQQLEVHEHHLQCYRLPRAISARPSPGERYSCRVGHSPPRQSLCATRAQL